MLLSQTSSLSPFYPRTDCAFRLYHPNLAGENSYSEVARQCLSNVPSKAPGVHMTTHFTFWDVLSEEAFIIKEAVKISK